MHKQPRPRTAVLLIVATVAAVIVTGGIGYISWTQSVKTATQATPAPSSKTDEGLAFIKQMYADYAKIEGSSPGQSAAERDAKLSPYLTSELLKKVDASQDYDAIACTYGGKPKTVSYGTPFLSAEATGEKVVVNASFQWADGSPSTSAGVFYDPQLKKIAEISCSGHSS